MEKTAAQQRTASYDTTNQTGGTKALRGQGDDNGRSQQATQPDATHRGATRLKPRGRCGKGLAGMAVGFSTAPADTPTTSARTRKCYILAEVLHDSLDLCKLYFT